MLEPLKISLLWAWSDNISYMGARDMNVLRGFPPMSENNHKDIAFVLSYFISYPLFGFGFLMLIFWGNQFL